MSSRFSGIRRLPQAGRYNKAELVQMHDSMISYLSHDNHLSSIAIFKMAEQLLYEATGQTLHGPYGPGVYDHGCRECEPPRRHYTDGPARETNFERGFFGGNSLGRGGGDDADQRGTSSRILTTREIYDGAAAIKMEWLKKGANKDYARQQAEKFLIREAGRRNAARRARRPSDGGYGRSSGPSRHGSSGGRHDPDYGWEGPQFDQYYTEAPRSTRGASRSHSYHYDEDEVPRSRGGRSHGSFSSRSGGYDGAYDDKPPRSSRGESRGYHTEERRPDGFSSSNYNGYDDRSEWKAGSDRSSGPPPGDDWLPAGVKPAKDLYAVLGVSPTATMDVLKKAHRKLSIAHHPDRVKGGEAAKKAATERMGRINQAYDVLKDAEMRYIYDKTGEIVSNFGQP
ncbi:DnaJ-domain-containing protein [Lizonia empirigonia]|nr:DnaJ-domain-containing protein [Lizonia empirigonia]